MAPARRTRPPSLARERALWEVGHDVVVGVDEVGRGAWAGPISVGAAVLPTDRRVYKVRDSKQLTEAERERLFDRVAGWCRAWAVGHATQEECDRLGMSAAQRLAATRAVDGLGLVPDAVLIDGKWDFVGLGNTTRIVKGDATCLSIAAASILAKVTRDRHMRAEAEHFPAYDFDRNKGYPCPRHKASLQAFGPTSIHRRTWVFMEHLCWGVRPQPDPTLFDAVP
jgi:ribonuclease HII